MIYVRTFYENLRRWMMDDKNFYNTILNITKLSCEKVWKEEISQVKSFI